MHVGLLGRSAKAAPAKPIRLLDDRDLGGFGGAIVEHDHHGLAGFDAFDFDAFGNGVDFTGFQFDSAASSKFLTTPSISPAKAVESMAADAKAIATIFFMLFSIGC